VERKNENRGYQRLRVWQDAATLFVEKVCLATRREADQLSEDDFEILDHQAFKPENGLLRLETEIQNGRCRPDDGPRGSRIGTMKFLMALING
jgi:hypothetical protein